MAVPSCFKVFFSETNVDLCQKVGRRNSTSINQRRFFAISIQRAGGGGGIFYIITYFVIESSSLLARLCHTHTSMLVFFKFSVVFGNFRAVHFKKELAYFLNELN